MLKKNKYARIETIEEEVMRHFIAGAEWQREQSPWISVKDRLPEEEEYTLFKDVDKWTIPFVAYRDASNLRRFLI